MKITTSVLESLLQTLDVETFIKGVQEFDNVTQRQCFLKAQKEIRNPEIVGLYGRECVKTAVQKIQEAIAD